MVKLIPLDNKKHKQHKVEVNTNFSFAQNDHLCSIMLGELAQVVSQSPIVFAKNDESHHELCALQGLDQKQNCFVSSKGLWKTTYIPARYRAYPFALAIEAKSKNKILCFRDDTNLILDNSLSKGTLLFNDDSSPSDHTKRIFEFLNALDQSQKKTAFAVSTIVEADILEDWPLKVKVGSAEKIIGGLKKINFEKFHSLTDKKLAGLKNAGSLPIMYAHSFSLSTIEKLGKLLSEDGPSTTSEYTSHKDRALAKKTIEDKKEVDNLVQNLLLDD
jgi:hypothetical protein